MEEVVSPAREKEMTTEEGKNDVDVVERGEPAQIETEPSPNAPADDYTAEASDTISEG